MAFEATKIFELLVGETSGIVITDANLSGYVQRTQSLAGSGDINFGEVNTASIGFSVKQLDGGLSRYTGETFTYKKGYATETTRSDLLLDVDAMIGTVGTTWAATVKGTTLTVYQPSGQSETRQLERAGGALIRNDGKLTVLFGGAPYGIRFPILADGTLGGAESAEITEYLQTFAISYARRGVSLWVKDTSQTGVLEETQVERSGSDRALLTTVYSTLQLGRFIMSRPSKSTGGVYTLSGVDRMTLFDVEALDVLKQAAQGVTALDLLQDLCAHVGVPLGGTPEVNINLPVAIPDVEAITGMELLRWLGEIVACSWAIDFEGYLTPIWLSDQTSRVYDTDGYFSLDVDEYVVPKVTKVMVDTTYAKTFGEAGSGANTLLVSGNSLIPYTEAAELAAVAGLLLPVAAAPPVYSPGSINTFSDPSIEVGHVFTVVDDDGETHQMAALQITETGFTCIIDSYGNERRDTLSYGATSAALLQQTVAALSSMLGSFPEQWEEQIKNTVSLITGGMGGSMVTLFNPLNEEPSGLAFLFDTDDITTAKKVLVINAGGIAFYDDGFDTENPDLSVPKYVVMNADGEVNASSIITGKIRTELLEADVITSDMLSTGTLEVNGRFLSVNPQGYELYISGGNMTFIEGLLTKAIVGMLEGDSGADVFSIRADEMVIGSFNESGPNITFKTGEVGVNGGVLWAENVNVSSSLYANSMSSPTVAATALSGVNIVGDTLHINQNAKIVGTLTVGNMSFTVLSVGAGGITSQGPVSASSITSSGGLTTGTHINANGDFLGKNVIAAGDGYNPADPSASQILGTVNGKTGLFTDLTATGVVNLPNLVVPIPPAPTFTTVTAGTVETNTITPSSGVAVTVDGDLKADLFEVGGSSGITLIDQGSYGELDIASSARVKSSGSYGVTGTFKDNNNNTITVKNGIITGLS